MPVVGYAPELTPSSLQSVTSRVPSIARSMPDRDGWPNVRTTTEPNARNISTWDRKRQDSPPSSRRTDEREERPHRRRGAHRHSGTRLAASQPDLPSTIPESVRGKMSGPGSQSQEDTQPVSQSFHKEFSERIKQQHAAKISGLTDAFSGTTESVQYTYHQGQAGHIDLLGVFEQPAITHSQTSVQDLSDDDAEPATQVANVRADLYPESKRFQPPATPSASSRKHNRAGEPTSNPNTTPRLPANPFAGQIGGLEGMMDASQLFKATQALSSPLLNRLPSDGMSERPSPDVHSVQRPATADPLSSPAKLPRGNMMRSVTEPQTTYISMKDSQAERERLSRLPVAGSGAGGQEVSDDDFDSEDSQIRRRRVRKKIDQETRDQFMGITARSRLVPTAHSRGFKGKRIRNSESNGRLPRESSDPVIISDDIPAEEIHANDTEEETEREEEQKQEDTDDEVDELADDNKENLGIKSIQVPMTESRSNYRASPPAATQSSPSSRVLRSPAHTRSLSGAVSHDHPSTATTKKSEGLPRPSQTVAIVDSQSSQSSTKADRTKTDVIIPPQAPDSSPSPASLIPQSQPNGADHLPSYSNKLGEQDCSPLAGPVGPVSSHEDVESSPPKPRGSSSPIVRKAAGSGKIFTGTHHTVNIAGSRQPTFLEHQETLPPPEEKAGIGKAGDQVLPRRESTAEEFPTSGATADAQSTEARSNGGSEKKVSHQQLSCVTIAQSMIPETSSPSEETDMREHVTTSPVKSGSTSLPDTVPVQPLDASTPFETARTHLSSHGPDYTAKSKEPKLHNSFMTSPRASRSRTIAEIAAGPSPGTASEDVDVDINLLTSDDVEYQAVIQQLSPARKKRRGNHGRGLRVLPALPVPSKAAVINDQEPLATSTRPSKSPPQVENGPVEAAALKPMQDVDGADGRTEPGARVKTSPRGRPRNIKPITTKVHSNTTNNGEQTSGVTARESSLKKAGKPTPEVPIAQSFERVSVAPNRVFAHFNGNCAAFYPATCIGLVGGPEPRYRVRFDDGTVDVISGYGIRRLELRTGDVVKIDIGGARTKNYVVESTQDQQLPTPNADPGTPMQRGRPRLNNSTPYPQTDIYGKPTVVVSVKQPRSMDVHHNNQQIHVPVKDVYLTQTLWTNFRDRDYTHPALPDQSISRLQTPSERPSTPSTPASRTRRINASGFSKDLSTSLSTRSVSGLFDNMVFAITNVNRVEDHARITQEILSNGGRILQVGFDELFHIPDLDITSPSKPSPNESRFEPTEMSMGLGFTCLIADAHCRRAKYIEALALGIPCLAPRWIQDCISKHRILPWIPYLLSSGESTYLNGAVRSRHLQPYAAETATLPSALENRPKLLDGHSVLLIMSKSEEKTMKSHPLITHALGASKVSRAINVDVAAKAIAEAQANGEPWDWVYSHDDEKGVETKLFGGGGDKAGRKRKRGRERESEGVGLVAGVKGRTKVVGNEFVIQSLILGQLVDD